MDSPTIAPPTPADALLARFRDTGDPAVLGALFDATAPELFHVALAIAPDAASAEDALQETFLAVIGAAARFDPSRRALPWLVGILRFKVDAIRQKKRPAPVAGRTVVDSEAVPLTGAEGSDDTAQIHREIEGLDEPYRNVALLRWRYGLSPAEIAHVRNEVPATTRSLLSRALERLKRVLTLLPAFGWGDVSQPRGLGPMRERLLNQAATAAKAGAVGGGASLLLGGLVVKKLALAVGVLAALFGGWLLLRPVSEGPSGGGLQVAGPPPLSTVNAPELATSHARIGDVKPPAVAADAIPVAPSGGVVLTGRVVDSHRRPVEGATVHVRFADRGPWVTKSGPDGRFHVAVGNRPPTGVWESGAVFASVGDSLSGSLDVTLAGRGGDDEDMGAVTLAPGMPLRARVTFEGKPVAGARVFARRISLGGRYEPRITINMWAVEGVSGPDGNVDLGPFPESLIEVLATTKDSLRRIARLPWSSKSERTVELALEPSRSVTVTVVDAGSGAPIVGARIEVAQDFSDEASRIYGSRPFDPALDVKPTDATGVTRIEGIGRDDVLLVRALATGYPTPLELQDSRMMADRTVFVQARATEFRVVLDRGRTVRWPVKAGELPVPAPGTPLRLVPIAGGVGIVFAPTAASVRLDGSEIVVEGVVKAAGFNSWVAAPDGSRAQLAVQPGADRGPEVAFRPARRVDVVLRDERGGPVAGMPVLIGEASYPMTEATPTDSDGHARFDDLFPLGWRAQARVLDVVRPIAGIDMGEPIGEVDLTKSDGRVEAVIPALRHVRIRVTIDGRPGLPGAFGQLIVKHKSLRRTDEDPEAGLIQSQWRGKETELPVYLSAPGYTDAYGTLGEESAGGPLTGQLELVSGGSMLVRVVPPADGVYDVSGVGPSGGGPFGSYRMGRAVPGEANLWVLENLRPGAWFAKDSRSGIAADPMEIRSGALAGEARLDLSRSGVVRGRVEVPDGYKAFGTHVVVEDAGVSSRDGSDGQRGTPVTGDGTFEVRIAGDRPVTISAVHPLLKPAAVGGSLTVSAPKDGVVLRMVAGPQATFRPDPVPTPPNGTRAARVFLFRGSVGGTPAARIEADVLDGVVRFGGFEPGRYSVVIDAYGLAPLFLENVVLTDGPTELGALRLGGGASVRVKVLVKDGQVAPGLDITARSKFEPDHWRQVHSRGDAEVVVRGLGKGAYKFTVMSLSNDKTYLTKTIESDGVGETTVTADLR